MPSLKVDGSVIFYSVTGSGQPIVFVHGSGCDSALWEFQKEELKKYFSVIALDLNGHGQSTKRDGDALATYAQDVLAMMEVLQQPVILVGHSLGSAIVQTVALQNPPNLVALGLIGAGAKLRVHPQLLEVVDHAFPKAVEMVLTWSFHASAKTELMQRAREQTIRNGQAMLSRDFRACDGFNVMEWLGKIAVPTLVICGRHDQLTPVKYSEYLQSHIAQSELCIIENAGHRVMEEQPAELNRALRNFCKAL